MLDGVMEDVADGVCDGVCDRVWLFGKDSFEECPLTLREPEPFMGRDPKKLKPFLFQCQLYFWGLSEFEDDSKRVTFVLSHLQDVAQEWFEPGLSGLTNIYPQWVLGATGTIRLQDE